MGQVRHGCAEAPACRPERRKAPEHAVSAKRMAHIYLAFAGGSISVAADVANYQLFLTGNPSSVNLQSVQPGVLTINGKNISKVPTQMPEITKAQLNGAVGNSAIVTDSANGRKPAYYNGSSWRYFSDDAAVT